MNNLAAEESTSLTNFLCKFEITELEAKSNILTYQVTNFLSQQTKYLFVLTIQLN